MRRWGHRERVSTAVPADVRDAAGLEPGERVLAAARSEDGDWLLGGRRRLVLVLADGEVVALPWEQVEDARWDREESRLRVSAVGAFGTARPEWTFALDDPERLLQLLRERVTASVVCSSVASRCARVAASPSSVGATRPAARSPGCTRTTRAWTPTTPRSSWSPTWPWRRPAPRSATRSDPDPAPI